MYISNILCHNYPFKQVKYSLFVLPFILLSKLYICFTTKGQLLFRVCFNILSFKIKFDSKIVRSWRNLIFIKYPRLPPWCHNRRSRICMKYSTHDPLDEQIIRKEITVRCHQQNHFRSFSPASKIQCGCHDSYFEFWSKFYPDYLLLWNQT